MEPQYSPFSAKNQIDALNIFRDYGILSRYVLSSELRMSLQQAEQLIDFLFLQGFLSQKEQSKTEIFPLKHSCVQGCKGCPLNTIPQCIDDTPTTHHYFLTEKAIEFLKSVGT